MADDRLHWTRLNITRKFDGTNIDQAGNISTYAREVCDVVPYVPIGYSTPA